jgi:hypothetical protein
MIAHTTTLNHALAHNVDTLILVVLIVVLVVALARTR